MRSLLAVLSLLWAFSVFGAPPYDVIAVVTAPVTGGAVDSYRLYLDGSLVGPVQVGSNTFPNLLTADGTYVFRVGAVNATGETMSDPVTVSVASLPLPGKPGLSIQVQCAPSCVVTVTP